MHNLTKYIKKIFRFAIQNYIISLFFLSLCLVILAAGYKILIKKPTYMYARIRVGQGFWWAATQKPSLWFFNAINQARHKKDGIKKDNIEILTATLNPWWATGQYDIYIDAKLKVSTSGSKYNFNRMTIGVGAPIDIELDKVQFSGTIIEMSPKPLVRKYVEKEIELIKKNALSWEYDAIPVGESFYNGEENIMQIIDKKAYDMTTIIPEDYSILGFDDRKIITVKVKMKGVMSNGYFVYSDDQVVIPGKSISFGTSKFVFEGYMVSKMN